MKKNILAVLATLAIGVVAHAQVFSNSAAPGDAYTNVGGSNQGQAIGTSGWFYNNVRNSGIAGISNTYARSGNGSARLQTTLGPGSPSSKADIEVLAGGLNVGGNFFATSSFGTLGNLVSFGYDWYRSSSSAATAIQHPALRLLLDADGNLATTNDRGGLVFERAYNGGVVPTDAWQTDSVTATTNVWSFGLGIPNAGNGGDAGYNNTFSQWVNNSLTVNGNPYSSPLTANSLVLGFSAGVGSGWGTFDGAVDNINWQFVGGPVNNANFEVVPEPMTMAVLALAGLAARRRKKKGQK